MVVIPENLQGVAVTDFTYPCKWCGATVTVAKATEQPHRCRIVIS